MTPHAFIAKWRGNELKERSASQSHFSDPYALLGVLDPISTDPTGVNCALGGRATFDVQTSMLSQRP